MKAVFDPKRHLANCFELPTRNPEPFYGLSRKNRPYLDECVVLTQHEAEVQKLRKNGVPFYLAQTLVLDPDIILMDEPFSALDIQTRQLMENEVLALWASKRKAVLFITHDLDEAIAMSDRVVVLSAGPAARPIGEFAIDLERPRDVAEVRTTPRFIELHKAIWDVLREEVLKGYAQQLQKA